MLRELLKQSDATTALVIDKGGFLITQHGDGRQFDLTTIAALASGAAVGLEDLKAALEDFIPPSYPTEIELQNLVAVLECTSREMVPRRFREMSRDKLVNEIKQLKVLLHERE